MDNKPLYHATISLFLALGNAVGDETLQRAGAYLRDLLGDGVLSRESTDIIEGALAAIDSPALDGPCWDVFEHLATLH
jgi:hypothetical protein